MYSFSEDDRRIVDQGAGDGDALAHDLEVCDVKETLLQVAVYAGAPASNTAFQIAKEEIDRLEQETIGQ